MNKFFLILLLLFFAQGKVCAKYLDMAYRCNNALRNLPFIEKSNYYVGFELLLLKDSTYVFSVSCGDITDTSNTYNPTNIKYCFAAGHYVIVANGKSSLIQLNDFDNRTQYVFKIINDTIISSIKWYGELVGMQFERTYFNFNVYYSYYGYDRFYKQSLSELKSDVKKLVSPIRLNFPVDSLYGKYLHSIWHESQRYLLLLIK